jgi:tRNA pseudouridine55 synthase
LARKGQEIERKERDVRIDALEIEKMDLPLIRFRVDCSKGTYIRTLAKDLGRKIGCGAHLVQLRRVRSGSFTLQRAVPWTTLCSLSLEGLSPWMIPLEESLPGTPELIGDSHLIRKARTGREMLVRDLSPQSLSDFDSGTYVKITAPGGGLIAIARSEVEQNRIPWSDRDAVVFRPLRVFHSSR